MVHLVTMFVLWYGATVSISFHYSGDLLGLSFVSTCLVESSCIAYLVVTKYVSSKSFAFFILFLCKVILVYN